MKTSTATSSSRKKTTKSKTETKSSSSSTSTTNKRSKIKSASIVVNTMNNNQIMLNTTIRISEILQKTTWLPKITENVIKKFELLQEDETIVIKFWVSMPTDTGKVYLLIGMDARKWWGKREITTYIDAGNLKLGVDYLVIYKENGKLVYGQISASIFK